MKIKLLGALCAGVLVLAAPASAHLQTQGDGDDVGGKLDLKEVAVRHNSNAVIVKMETYDRFGSKALENHVFIWYLKKDGGIGSFVEISYVNGGVKGRIVKCDTDPQRCYYQKGKLVDATRPNQRSVKVRIPRKTISHLGSVLRWYAVSGDGNYIDTAPNSGSVRHNIGAAG
jgi:hypothetical protein